MRLRFLEEDFTVCRVAEGTEVRFDAPYCFYGKTAEERSLVCRTADVPCETLAREDGWRGFYIEGVLDFSLIGILAKIAAVLAEEKIGIFAVSTYNTDYIFFKREHELRAKTALSAAGYALL